MKRSVLLLITVLAMVSVSIAEDAKLTGADLEIDGHLKRIAKGEQEPIINWPSLPLPVTDEPVDPNHPLDPAHPCFTLFPPSMSPESWKCSRVVAGSKVCDYVGPVQFLGPAQKITCIFFE